MRFEKLLLSSLPVLCALLAFAIGLNFLLFFQQQVEIGLHQALQGVLVFGLIASGAGWIRLSGKRGRALEKAAADSTAREERLIARLNRDTATGLINHRVFTEEVRSATAAPTASRAIRIFSIDLDGRWPGCETCGTAAEEELFAAAADLLRHATDRIEGTTCLARSAGKGFLLMTLGEQDLGLSPQDIAERIHDGFLRPVRTAQGNVLVSPAIGYTERLCDERDAEELIQDACMAVAKAAGHGRRQTIAFEPIMREELERLTIVGNALAGAIEANECLPHFQPQFNLRTGRIYGLEALARWYHTDLGWISPSEFIPIAERTGTINTLGWKILETSCSEIQLLPANLSLSVNLSVAQLLSDDMAALLDDCLDRTGLAPSRLKLEISETALDRSDLDRIVSALSVLRDLGVGISLDDFGAGQSALAILSDFEWDEIKIDRTLAARAVKDARQRKILELILGVAETTNTSVLIEGIETIEQRDVLADMGCANGQGYLFGGPMAIDDITTLFFADAGRHDQVVA
jgi:EAL domain-containing protein (putative c-di-GMP-specific phosphodiesterase class I)/GGDEF domain-containing protein